MVGLYPMLRAPHAQITPVSFPQTGFVGAPDLTDISFLTNINNSKLVGYTGKTKPTPRFELPP